MLYPHNVTVESLQAPKPFTGCHYRFIIYKKNMHSQFFGIAVIACMSGYLFCIEYFIIVHTYYIVQNNNVLFL